MQIHYCKKCYRGIQEIWHTAPLVTSCKSIVLSHHEDAATETVEVQTVSTDLPLLLSRPPPSPALHPSLTPGNHSSALHSYKFVILKGLHKWKQIVCNLLIPRPTPLPSPAEFSGDSGKLFSVSIVSSFLLLSSISWCGPATVFFNHSAME